MKERIERWGFMLAVAVGTLWAYWRVHTYATGQDPRTFLIAAKALLAGNGAPGLVVPGWPMVLAAVMGTFGTRAAFWTNMPLFALLVVALAALAGRLEGNRRRGMAIAAGSALLMLGGYEHNPHFLLWVFRQTPVYLASALALLCAVRAVEGRRAGRRAAATAWLAGSLAWVGAGVLLRETGVLLLPPLGLYLLADALGWVGPAGAAGAGKGRWLLAGLFAGTGAFAAAVAAAAWAAGVLPASAQAGYLIEQAPSLFAHTDSLCETLAMIPDELGLAGCAALAVGATMSLRRHHRGWLFLVLIPAVEYLLFDGMIKAHRRFFLSTLFFLSPVAMLGACAVAEKLWGVVRRALRGKGLPAVWPRRAPPTGRVAAWAAMAAWYALVVMRIGPWGVRVTGTEVDRALEILRPWTGPGRELLVDGRARFLGDVLGVFTDWPVREVDPEDAAECVRTPPLAFVRPENDAALHWASPGPPAGRILERHGRLAEIPGGGAFSLGRSAYRVMLLEAWTSTGIVCRLPPPPVSGMSPPPPSTPLRLEAPDCAAETAIRVSVTGHPLAERLEPGCQWLAVPREWLETAEGEKDGIELCIEADAPIPDDFRPRWIHPDAPLEMEFGAAFQPGWDSYLPREFREWEGLRGLDRQYPYWPAPLRAREFSGRADIRLPEGVGEAGAEYIARLGLACVYNSPAGHVEVTVSLPEFPEAGEHTVTAPHLDRAQEFLFALGRLPRPPRILRIRAEPFAYYNPMALANPRHANLQLGRLMLSARRDVDSLSVRVGGREDGTLLGTGFHGREQSEGPGHGRWTDGHAEVFLPLRAGRDYRLELDFSQQRPPAVAPAVPRLALNGHPLETEATDTGLRTLLPAEWLREGNCLSIDSETWSPADHGAGDDRILGIYLRTVRADPA